MCRAGFGLAPILVAGGALAQGTPPAGRPAGPALRNPVELHAPAPAVQLAPRIEGPPIAAEAGPGAQRLERLGEVRVTGATALPAEVLAEAVAGLAGATVPLTRIEEARLALLRAYRQAGFPFITVNAGLAPGPAPEGGGTVADLTFGVIEGFVAEVRLEGDIGPAGTQALRFLDRVTGERPVSAAAIERALLLVSDIPGVTLRGTLRPLPSEPGALQLVAQVERRAVSGYVTFDNRGSKQVGPWQGLLVGGLNAFTEFGERTELSIFGAQDSAQYFVQGSVEAFLGGSGLRLRLYAGGGETRPTGSFRAIGYYGQTQIGGITLNYPVVRSRPVNLYAVGSFEIFEGVIETGLATRARASRDGIRSFRAGFDGQLLDSWVPFLPGATNLASVRLSQGVESFGATRTGNPTSGRSGADTFGFTKISGEVQRTQPLFRPFEGALLSLKGLVGGQWSSDVLPQAEKFYLGGNRLGRGFYSGQVTGDRAWGITGELLLDTAVDLPVPAFLGSGRLASQFYFFRDIGRTVDNGLGDPGRRLSSWGGGVRMVLSEALAFDVEGVHRVTTRPEGGAADPLKETAVLFRTLFKF